MKNFKSFVKCLVEQEAYRNEFYHERGKFDDVPSVNSRDDEGTGITNSYTDHDINLIKQPHTQLNCLS